VVEDGCVLVGTDFSPGAAAALTEARLLAERLGCGVRLVHVVESTHATGWSLSDTAIDWLHTAGLEEAALDVRFGRPWVELVRMADTCRPMLLVVGSHGTSGYQPVSVGTTAQRLTLTARHPVLLVSPQQGVQRRWAGAAP
jgi:nucleotide-binding universal stress UspA family protein